MATVCSLLYFEGYTEQVQAEVSVPLAGCSKEKPPSQLLHLSKNICLIQLLVSSK